MIRFEELGNVGKNQKSAEKPYNQIGSAVGGAKIGRGEKIRPGQGKLQGSGLEVREGRKG